MKHDRANMKHSRSYSFCGIIDWNASSPSTTVSSIVSWTRTPSSGYVYPALLREYIILTAIQAMLEEEHVRQNKKLNEVRVVGIISKYLFD